MSHVGIFRNNNFTHHGKAAIKKSAKEASNIFHNIMQASVKGNPKPAKKAAPKKKKHD